MSLTQIGVILAGLWLILTSQEPVSTTLTLIIGIVIIVLVVLDSSFARGYRDRA